LSHLRLFPLQETPHWRTIISMMRSYWWILADAPTLYQLWLSVSAATRRLSRRLFLYVIPCASNAKKGW
jgi:hypothetical protein